MDIERHAKDVGCTECQRIMKDEARRTRTEDSCVIKNERGGTERMVGRGWRTKDGSWWIGKGKRTMEEIGFTVGEE